MHIKNCLIFLLLLGGATVQAQTTFTSNLGGGTGSWDTPATWDQAAVPGSADHVVILGGDTVEIDIGTGPGKTITNLTINSSGVLSQITKSIDIQGNYTNNGLHDGTEKIDLTGSGTNIDGTGNG